MKQLIITSGNKYTDIDAYACAIAYKELCDLKNIPADVVLPSISPNQNIFQTL